MLKEIGNIEADFDYDGGWGSWTIAIEIKRALGGQGVESKNRTSPEGTGFRRYH